jgi:hypothetical protein
LNTRRARIFWLAAVVFIVATIPAFIVMHRAAATVTYQDLPAKLFPAEQYELLGAVYTNDLAVQRAHAWKLWAALNTASHSTAYGQRLPIWQTWYSSTEVYDGSLRGKLSANAHPLDCCTFFIPEQDVIEHKDVDKDQPAVTMAFVKFNAPAAQFIIDRGYDKQSTLNELNAQYNHSRTPVTMRQIQPFPRTAVAIKLTFWLIRAHGITPVPYWDPAYDTPRNGQTPNHLTWERCVAVDANGTLPEGTKQIVNCNGTLREAPVVHLSRFYTFRLVDPTDVATVAQFAKHISMNTDQERVVTGEFTPQVGDYLALTAMHVTTKEIPDWTFQTFWWTPFPSAAPFGNDRPAYVRPPFDNYSMCNAYSVDTPTTASGAPHICFNPYLEADLGPTKPYVMNGKRMPADPMAGTRSNCMACHSRAAWPAKMDPPYLPHTSSMGGVANPGFVPRNDPYFQGITTTDFLWSIPLESRSEKT